MFSNHSWQAQAKNRFNGLLSGTAIKPERGNRTTGPALICRDPNEAFIGSPSTYSLGTVQPPPPVAIKLGHVTSSTVLPQGSPSATELDTIQWGKRLDGPDHSEPQTPAELEDNSRPVSPAQSGAQSGAQSVGTVTLPTVAQPYIHRWRMFVITLAIFTQGLNDSAPGALLPSMESHYHIKYAIVSLIFVGNALGFIAAAPICHWLNERFGRAKVLSACSILNAVAYAAIVCEPPWPVVVVAFFLLGFGLATILALNSVFLVNLQGGTVLLGYIYGCYGIGGVCSPFMATAMVSSGIRWSFFYIIPLVLSLVSSALFYCTFTGYETESSTIQLFSALEQSISRQSRSQEKAGILRKAIQNRTTLLGALLIFAYQGAEVSISGWVISFLIDYRNGDPSQVGYVTSGFWGGITLGRFVLVTPAHKIGDRLSVVVLIAGTAAFQFIVWFLPNVIGNAVAVSLIGFLLGPIYPCATGVFSRLLPRHLQITSLGFISSMGSSGGAIAPFFTGLLAQKLGTVVLNPICIALCVVAEFAWLGLPRVVKRTE